METDMKYLYKALTATLSSSQQRLLQAISQAPTAHPYSSEYMTRCHLTRGGIASGLRRLTKLCLVGQENGKWQLEPPELRIWLEALHDRGPEAAESLRWAKVQPSWVRKLQERTLTQKEDHAI